jgi:hypothetical protein
MQPLPFGMVLVAAPQAQVIQVLVQAAQYLVAEVVVLPVMLLVLHHQAETAAPVVLQEQQALYQAVAAVDQPQVTPALVAMV